MGYSTRRSTHESAKLLVEWLYGGREGNFLMVVRLKNIIMILEDVMYLYLYTSVGLLYRLVVLIVLLLIYTLASSFCLCE